MTVLSAAPARTYLSATLLAADHCRQKSLYFITFQRVNPARAVVLYACLEQIVRGEQFLRTSASVIP